MITSCVMAGSVLPNWITPTTEKLIASTSGSRSAFWIAARSEHCKSGTFRSISHKSSLMFASAASLTVFTVMTAACTGSSVNRPTPINNSVSK